MEAALQSFEGTGFVAVKRLGQDAAGYTRNWPISREILPASS